MSLTASSGALTVQVPSRKEAEYARGQGYVLYRGDCLQVLERFEDHPFDLIFADPPYFLSNGGITCHAGRMVSVNKGDWDKLPGRDPDPVRVRMEKVHEFNREWLAACQRV